MSMKIFTKKSSNFFIFISVILVLINFIGYFDYHAKQKNLNSDNNIKIEKKYTKQEKMNAIYTYVVSRYNPKNVDYQTDGVPRYSLFDNYGSSSFGVD